MKRLGKYGATPTACAAGHKHPSRKEAKRCNDLHLLQRAGEISGLEIQPRFDFVVNGLPLMHGNGRRCSYVADFRYRTVNGRQIVEDTKGMVVRDWPLRRALFCHLFPELELREG